MGRAAALLAGCTAGLLLTAAPASAGIWTPVPSGTTDDINAIEYQGPSRLWYATGNGKIFRWNGSAFELRANAPGIVFNDIEFQEGGNVGFAVGAGGFVARTVDGGLNWASVTLPAAASDVDCTTDTAAGDLDAIRFQGSSRAWIAGPQRQIWRTVAGATPANVGQAGGWEDINDNGASCKVGLDIDDIFPVPGSDVVYFVAKSFGQIYYSANALATASSPKSGDAGNGFEGRRRLAGDAGNPNRQWAVMPGAGGSFQRLSESGWNAADYFDFADDDRDHFSPLYDIAARSGTVLTAGDGGRVEHSTDGKTFFGDPADGALATAGWRAVALADGAAGAIGGQNGVFAMTTQANVLPTLPGDGGGSGSGGSGSGSGTGGSGGGSTIPTRRPATTPPGTTTPTLPAGSFSLSGSAGSVSARRARGNRIAVRIRGTLRLPRGVSRTRGCTGRVVLRVKRGRRTVGSRSARVNRRCRFSVTVRVRRSRLSPRATRVTAQLLFRNNRFLTVRSQTLSVPIR